MVDIVRALCGCVVVETLGWIIPLRASEFSDGLSMSASLCVLM